jgi:hypothetical protein
LGQRFFLGIKKFQPALLEYGSYDSLPASHPKLTPHYASQQNCDGGEHQQTYLSGWFSFEESGDGLWRRDTFPLISHKGSFIAGLGVMFKREEGSFSFSQCGD